MSARTEPEVEEGGGPAAELMGLIDKLLACRGDSAKRRAIVAEVERRAKQLELEADFGGEAEIQELREALREEQDITAQFAEALGDLDTSRWEDRAQVEAAGRPQKIATEENRRLAANRQAQWSDQILALSAWEVEGYVQEHADKRAAAKERAEREADSFNLTGPEREKRIRRAVREAGLCRSSIFEVRKAAGLSTPRKKRQD